MDCLGYEEEYKIHSDGRVESKKSGRFLKPQLDGGGYYYVGLNKNNIRTNHKIHKLVATHYIPNPDNLPVADHIDFNKSNNDISNLRWVSYRESSLHKTNSLPTPNIYINYSKNYQVRINVNGFHFDKTFKTLAEAEQARDAFNLEHGL